MRHTGSLNNTVSGLALGLVIVALVGMTGYSVLYRVGHPGLTRQVQHSHAGGQDRDMMGMVGQLMQKLKEHPQDVPTLRSLAQVFMQMQAWDQAQNFWQRVLKIEPDNVQARQQSALCLFRMEKYQAAAAQLEKVLATAPDSAYAKFNLGLLYTHYLHDAEAGRTYFQQVIESPSAGPELKKQAKKQLKTTHGG